MPSAPERGIIMTYSRRYALKLIRSGLARRVGMTSDGTRWPDEPHYVIIDRLDTQTVHHYRATVADYRVRRA